MSTVTAKPSRANRVPIKGQKSLLPEEATEKKSVEISTSQRLAEVACGCRLSIRRMGTSRAVDKDTVQEAARHLGGQDKAISASKRLVDSKHEAVKEVNAVLNVANAYWKACTLPLASIAEGDTPEPGLRLIRRDRIAAFRERMTELRKQLANAVIRLGQAMPEIKAEARERLGERLYREQDYPKDVSGLFQIYWTFTDVHPPSYLEKLDPVAYKEERARVARQFEDTLSLAQQTIIDQLQGTISLIIERLSGERDRKADHTGKLVSITPLEDKDSFDLVFDPGNGDPPKTQRVGAGYKWKVKVGDDVKKGDVLGIMPGKQQTFKDSAIGNLSAAIQYFRNLGEVVGCDDKLGNLVDVADALIRRGLNKSLAEQLKGRDLTDANVSMIAKELRDSRTFRDTAARGFTELNKELQKYIAERPRRKLVTLKD